MMKIDTSLPCDKRNYSARKGRIAYIVLHYVGATGGARANALYYSRNAVGASAHYFVGHANEGAAVYQSVRPEDRAWHCGSETGRYRHPHCRNDNAIGIELCCHKAADGSWYFDKETLEAGICLTRMLMRTYGIPVQNVLRHYDVTGKLCPAPLVDTAAWTAFLARLTELTEPNDIVWEYGARGIVSDTAGMVAEMEQNTDGRLYWLARKALQYIRELEEGK